MLVVGAFFEGIDSGRGSEWRHPCSLPPRGLQRVETPSRVPDHSWLPKARRRSIGRVRACRKHRQQATDVARPVKRFGGEPCGVVKQETGIGRGGRCAR